MRTLGTDLSSQPKKTAACVIDWVDKEARITRLEVGVDDNRILSLAGTLTKGIDWIAIDAPFGWPDDFVAMVSQHHSGAADLLPLTDVVKRKLCYRLTDHRVYERTGNWPLSVAADRIAIVTMRGIRLLAKLDVNDLAGVDGVAEVYPAAALRRWELIPAGFKGPKNGAALADFVQTLQAKAPWLILPEAAPKLFAKNDHAFDALICALVARATALNLTERPAPHELPPPSAKAGSPFPTLARSRSCRTRRRRAAKRP